MILQAKLLEGFYECPGQQDWQIVVLQYLKLDQEEKSLCTRTVKEAFTSASIKRVRRKGGELDFF